MEKSNILLINPPKTKRKGSGYISKVVDIGIPIGLLSIAAVLEKNNFNVKIIDCVGDPKAHSQENDDGILYGISKEDLSQRIKDFNPLLVGISGQFVGQYEEVLWVSKIVKEIIPNVPVAVGGSFLHKDLLTRLESVPTIDICAFGEGENTMVDLSKYVQKKMKIEDVAGIAWKDKEGKAHSNKPRQFIFDLDELPLPAYHLVDMKFYLNLPKKGFYNRVKDRKRTITFITSRGCPEQCSFCSVPRVSGKVWRKFSVDYVLNHIELLVNNYGVERLHIEDDNFTLDMDRARKIAEGIIERGIKVEWDTLNGVRADRLDEDLIKKFKKSGCIKLCISPEVGNQEILDKIINKRMDLKDVVKVAGICKKVGMPLQAYFIIGFPGENKKTLQDTVDFAKMLMKDYNVVVATALRATPFYGTPLYDMAKKLGVLKEPDPSQLDKSLGGGIALIETDEFNAEDLDKINRDLIRTSYYYSAKRYLKHPVKLIKRFRDPYLIASTIKRFVKGSHV